jgi:hypothetical protein
MTAALSRHDRPDNSVRDPATRRWVEQAWMPGLTPTRDQLLTFAQKRIAELTAADAPGSAAGWEPVHGPLATFAVALLGIIINSDDLATPQVAPTPDGGLDIQWLVSGDSLEIIFDVKEGVSVVGRYDSGDCAIDFDWGLDGDIEALHKVTVAAGTFLGKISTGIQHRLPIW